MRHTFATFSLRIATGVTVALLGSFAPISWGDDSAAIQSEESSAVVEAASPDALKEQVQRWIGQLASPRRSQRALGERELISLGPDALEFFPAPSLLTDVAAREALIRVRSALEQEQGRQTLISRLVTLKGTLPLSKIVATLAKQTGNRLELSPLVEGADLTVIDVEWERRSFWQCIEQLRGSGVDLMQPESGPALLIPRSLPMSDANVEPAPVAPVPGVSSTSPVDAKGLRLVAISGPFRSIITSMSWRGDVNAAGERVLRIRFEQQSEPRLRPLFGDFRDQHFTVTARQSGGGEVDCPPFNPLASQQPEFTAQRGVELAVDVIVPQAKTAMTFHIQQTNQVTLAAVPIPIEFSHLEEPLPQTKRRGGVSVSLERIDSIAPGGLNAEPESRAMIRMTSRYDSGGPAFESHRVGLLHRQLLLLNGQGGGPRSSDSSRSIAEGDGSFTLEYRFEHLPVDWRTGSLIYEAPTAIITAPVANEFENLAIPDFAP